MSHNNNQNPYAKASGAYDTNAQAHAGSQREMEGRILLKSNKQLQLVLDNWENRAKDQLEEALTYNRQIWMLFYDTALENKDGGRPNDLRSNIVNLANFIFKREMDILANPEPKKLEILLNINREVAAGLMVNNEAAPAPSSSAPQENARSTTDISG
ncbi:MAG: flagellar biosynthesis regulator FlaF [Alphaproteobacteria bacterium]